MLGRGNLMMAGLNLKSHILQVEHDIPAYIFSQVNGGYIKITGCLMGIGGGPSLLIRVEKEKLALRPYIKYITHVRGLSDRPL